MLMKRWSWQRCFLSPAPSALFNEANMKHSSEQTNKLIISQPPTPLLPPHTHTPETIMNIDEIINQIRGGEGGDSIKIN